MKAIKNKKLLTEAGWWVFGGIQNEKQSDSSCYFLFSDSWYGQLKLTIALS